MNRAILCDSDIGGLYPYSPSGTPEDIINSNHSYHLRTIEGAVITDSKLPLAEREGKIFIATILSYTTPNSNGTVYGNQAQLRNAATLVSPTTKNPNRFPLSYEQLQVYNAWRFFAKF